MKVWLSREDHNESVATNLGCQRVILTGDFRFSEVRRTSVVLARSTGSIFWPRLSESGSVTRRSPIE